MSEKMLEKSNYPICFAKTICTKSRTISNRSNCQTSGCVVRYPETIYMNEIQIRYSVSQFELHYKYNEIGQYFLDQI